MSTLSKKELTERLNYNHKNKIVVSPILNKEKQLNQIGIDCRLGNQFIIFKSQNIDSIDIHNLAKNFINFNLIQEEIVIPFKKYFVLHPRTMVLGSTFEFIGLPDDISASIEGRSSWARVGLIIATAVYIEPGFKGCITLELANVSNIPIKLYPGIRIAQLICYQNTSPSLYSKDRKYLYPIGPDWSKVHKDPDNSFFLPK